MLASLHITNFVLIDKLRLEFGKGFCVLTGETGAGKSILLDALGLVLGGKADAKLIRKGEDSASVTAEFLVSDAHIPASFFEENGLDKQDTLILRRQLIADGKTRNFINGQPASAKALKEIGAMLVEIHGQQNQQGLMDPGSHVTILDRYGKLEKERNATRDAYRKWREAVKSLVELQEEVERLSREKEYLEHVGAELKKLAAKPGEEEELAERRTRMMQAEKSMGSVQDVLELLQGAQPIVQQLRTAQGQLIRTGEKAGGLFDPAVESLEKAQVEVDNAAELLERFLNESDYNPQELERIEERLFALKAASRKFQRTAEELPALYKEISEKLTLLATQETKLKALEKESSEARKTYISAASALREKRTSVSGKLEKAVMKELGPLKMAATQFKVASEALPEDNWGEKGMDRVSFEVATNKGSEMGALHKIASGGELSRFMLALVLVLSGATAAPTMIFDEIDAGTSGAVADAIGQRLGLLGSQSQVMAVSHLPQVAARGTQHFYVEKKEKAGKTTTIIRELKGEERREELARMLSGASISAEARKAADQLLKAAG